MAKTVERFLDGSGRVEHWPTKQADKEQVLDYLITKFDMEAVYDEPQVNAVLKGWHTFSDWPLLRRELVERGYFDRQVDGTGYRRRK